MKPILEESYPLSPMQQGMLFHHLSEGHAGVDIEQIVFELDEQVDVERLRRAWGDVAEHHESLRKSFRWADVDEPLQVVWSRTEPEVVVEDWSSVDARERERRLDAYLERDRLKGFDLAQPPVWRLALFHVGGARIVGVWSFHHLLMDGRSFALVLEDVFQLYEQRSSPRARQARSFAEHVAWLRAKPGELEARRFFEKQLAGLTLPTPLVLPGRPEAGARGRGEADLRLDVDASRRLRSFADAQDVTVNTLVQAAWALVLARYSGEPAVVLGATRVCRHAGGIVHADVAGVFINTLPVPIRIDERAAVGSWLRTIREYNVLLREHEHTALVDVQAWAGVTAGAHLFESLIVFDKSSLDTSLKQRGPSWSRRRFTLKERTSFPLTLYGYDEDALRLLLAYDRERFADEAAAGLLRHLATALEELAADGERPLSEVSILPAAELAERLRGVEGPPLAYPRDATLPDLFEAQAARTPGATAVICGERSITYAELDGRANALARELRELGVARGKLVGIATSRSIEMLVAVLGVQKAGGAYVPLDPAYPAERIAFMIADSEVPLVVTEREVVDRLQPGKARLVVLDASATSSAQRVPRELSPDDLAYVIYTSGSTGRPKGVMVEHRNVVNFFAAMDERIGGDTPGVWLAVTSLSFDISVLELAWTLARGFTVVLHAGIDRQPAVAGGLGSKVGFSLFYFASDEDEFPDDKYRLVLDGARFADTHGFEAVWTPERHFHRFGGLYPNPAVISAAIAATTERVKIRAGSVVLPLHHPLRVAEEWSIVDNLSHGRVGISVASGWHPNDFVLSPANYADRKNLMIGGIEQVRRLWRGETVPFPAPDGRDVETSILPRPIQAELPIWVTAAGNPETFRAAGEVGAHVLTHLLGQTLEETGEKLAVYRKAWKDAGHPGDGHVTLMLHTFIGTDLAAAKELVRGPMKAYLASALDLIKGHVASWSAVRTPLKGGARQESVDVTALSPEDRDSLLDHSFERYFETSSLLGTLESCLPRLERMIAIGVDEIACLVDFGVPRAAVLENLEHLDALRRRVQQRPARSQPAETIGALVRKHGVTHMQCTPSLAKLLLADAGDRASLDALQVLMLGGEAFPAALARELLGATSARILNMYGPTETTIWSSTHHVAGADDEIPIGTPVANTRFVCLDAALRPVPRGLPGELYIGGDGVVRGYLRRPELSAERFLPDRAGAHDARLYRTGDVVRERADGTMEFLGRVDNQVKLRGHRIELGEIESCLERHPSVNEAAVVASTEEHGDQRLIGYVVARAGATLALDELRAFVAARLPEVMVPARVIALDEMPRTPNGKLDRKRLPRPEQRTKASASVAAPPANDVERRLALIWAELLGVEHVGRDDNFFDLGGHSLLVLQLQSRLRQALGCEVAVTDLFRFPTVRALAGSLGTTSGASAAPAPRRTDSGASRSRRDSLRERRLQARARPQGDAPG